MKYFAALGVALLVIAAASVGPWAPSPFTSQTGTNTTAAAWRTALGAAASSTLSGYVTNHTGAATNLALTGGSVTTQTNTDLTASRVVVSSASKVLASSSVTSTTLGYLDATSSVQTQLDGKPTVALTNLALLNTSQTFTGQTNRFSSKVGIGATSDRQLTLSAAEAIFAIDRAANSGNSVINYRTGSTDDWLLGCRSTGDSNFYLYSYGAAANALTVLRSSANVGIGTDSAGSRLHVTGTGLTIGTSGTAVTKYFSATATLNFGSILASGSEDLTITVTGAAVNDTVTLGLPATVLAGAIFNAWVSAADTVTVRCNNAGSIAVDPASATYRVGVTSH
jgi:hypothetical protein